MGHFEVLLCEFLWDVAVGEVEQATHVLNPVQLGVHRQASAVQRTSSDDESGTTLN